MNSTRELKELTTQRTKTLELIRDLSDQVVTIKNRITNEQSRMKTIDGQIAKLKAGPPVVTEHAILRYLERVRGVDIEAIRQEMLDPKIVGFIDTLGSGLIPHPNGYKLVVKKRVIVTVEV